MDSINAALKAKLDEVVRRAEVVNAEQMACALEAIEAALDSLNGRPPDIKTALKVAQRSLALVRRTERMLSLRAHEEASTVVIQGAP